MNRSHQETSSDIQETEFGGPAVSKQRRIIYFSSGETLEEEDSEEEEEEEEEEESSNRPFREPAERWLKYLLLLTLSTGVPSLASVLALLSAPPSWVRADVHLLQPRLSFRNVAFLVARISLLTCDFLGERLAGALGLNAAKYQYAIDQYHRDHERKSSQTADDLREGQAETLHLSPGLDGSHYGATRDARRPLDSQDSCDEKHMDRNAGCHNRGYQADQDNLE